MRFWEYVGSKTVGLCLTGMAGLYLVLVSWFCGVPPELVGLLLLGGGAGTAGRVIIGWRRANRRLTLLRKRLDALPEKHLIGETWDAPRDALEQEYYLLMKEVSRSAIDAVEQARQEQRDYCEYVERWVHELKTPLTACSLILANGAEPGKLRRELRRADNLTEAILTYAKLPTAEKDTQISLTHLHAVCHQAVREGMELLIAADISVSVEGDAAVYTDAKLLVVILKQLLINCAKYCPRCRIHIALAEGALTLTDNGTGIPAHELPRVTERGFTGAAGRSRGGSTGMGLYIVGELCAALNIGLKITSEEGSFTRFAFSFPA